MTPRQGRSIRPAGETRAISTVPTRSSTNGSLILGCRKSHLPEDAAFARRSEFVVASCRVHSCAEHHHTVEDGVLTRLKALVLGVTLQLKERAMRQ